MTMTLQTIPRTAVKSWLSVVRLPLSAAELATGKRGATDWPPAIAFEGFEASVKRGVGTLIGDDELVREGSLESGKVAQLRLAAELEAEAERRRQQGEQRFEDQKDTVQERGQRLEREQREREEKLKRETEARKRSVEQVDRRKAEAARAADEKRQKAVAAKERQARATRLAAESEALEQERDAVEAKAEVLEVDQKLEAAKAARKR